MMIPEWWRADAILVIMGTILLLSPLLVWRTGRDPDRVVLAVLEAIRWIAGGIIVAVVADVYLNTRFASVQFFFVCIGLSILFSVEYVLLNLDPTR